MTKKGSVVTPGGGGAAAANDSPSKSLTAKAVIDYLQHNPNLLDEHPELLESLTPPSRSDGNVVDMQHVMLFRLREENRKLRDAYASVIATARGNRSTQTQIHECVLQILSAGSFERLIHTVTADLSIVLNVDAVTLCIEAGDVSIPRAFAAGLRSLPEGTSERYLGPGRDIALASDITGDRKIFGEAAGLIRSQALARLRISPHAPKGLLAIGSRDIDAFQKSQGTELISFLARSLEVTIRQWLNLSS